MAKFLELLSQIAVHPLYRILVSRIIDDLDMEGKG